MHTITSLAVLTALTAPSLGVAVLSGELASDDGWVQLLPDGEFSAVDGRPHDVPGGKWKLDERIANRLIEQARLKANDLVIDYEHQTLKTEANGKPAPAAGWFKDMQYRPGKGLFIKPAWLSNAQAAIDAKEYRYLSAVFPYDRATGEPLEIQMAALTNFPGLDGLDALASLAAQRFSPNHPKPRETTMDQELIELLASLGIRLEEGQSPSAQHYQTAQAALKALQTKAATADALGDEVAALKADTGNIDLSRFVPASTYQAVVAELATLKAANDHLTVDQVITAAQEEGKFIAAAELDYLKQLGNQSLAALKANLATRPVLAALSGSKQTAGKAPKQDKPSVAALTADQKSIADQMGISHDDLAKELGA